MFHISASLYMGHKVQPDRFHGHIIQHVDRARISLAIIRLRLHLLNRHPRGQQLISRNIMPHRPAACYDQAFIVAFNIFLQNGRINLLTRVEPEQIGKGPIFFTAGHTPPRRKPDLFHPSQPYPGSKRRGKSRTFDPPSIRRPKRIWTHEGQRIRGTEDMQFPYYP